MTAYSHREFATPTAHESVTLAYVDQGYTGEEPAEAAAARACPTKPERS